MSVHKIAPAALITGASGGIGYELAKLFAKDHHNLVLVARNGPRLAQVADELQRQFESRSGHLRWIWLRRTLPKSCLPNCGAKACK